MKIDFDPTYPKYIEKIEKRLLRTEFVSTFTPPQDEDIVIMGTYSRTWRNKPKREVLTGKGVEVFGRVDTPTAHTRDYVSMCYPRRPAKKEQRDILKKKRMPLYSYPCIMSDAIYLDIKSAWSSIVNLVGWDCEYWPGRWLSRGTEPYDFPLASNKVARSAMVTIGRTTPLPIWKNGHMTYCKMYNATENYHIWGVIADVLNAIGSFAVDVGARYVNTDGFIISRRNSLALLEYINSWGLEARAKYQGIALVCGPGSYSIGSHYSHRPMSFIACDYIDRNVDVKFLRPRVSKRSRIFEFAGAPYE